MSVLPLPRGSSRGDGVQVGEVQRLLLRGDAVQRPRAIGGVAVPTVGWAVEELHRAGEDAHGLGVAGVGGLPLAPVQATVDRYGAALAHVLGDVLAAGAEYDDVEEVGLLAPRGGLPVPGGHVERRRGARALSKTQAPQPDFARLRIGVRFYS
jgi:hypothetical protein